MKGVRNLKKTAHGFTLVELLVVIAIIAILAAVVVLIINPLEMMKQARDTTRMTDLAALQSAINVAVQEATASGSDILCVGGMTGGICTGDSGTGSRTPNGTGWVKVNLSAQKSVSVPTLPIDPLNTGSNIYTYTSDGNTWEINAVLESEKYSPKMGIDGGDQPAVWEVGSSLSLIGP